MPLSKELSKTQKTLIANDNNILCGLIEYIFKIVDTLRLKWIRNPQQNNQNLCYGLMVFVNYLLTLLVEKTLKMKRKRLGGYAGLIFN